MSSDHTSLASRVGQLFCIGIPGPELDAATRELLDEVRPGGICLFARNIRSASQTRELLDGLRETSDTVPILSVDQEGGTVDRLRRITTPMPAAASIRTPEDARELGQIVAETLRLLGFNLDFAPVVDVVDESRAGISRGLAGRTFGRTKEDVVELAGAFLNALQAGGIVGCLKHFPGLGAATVDSHEELPRVEITAGELDDKDLFPYRRLLRRAYCVMAGHVSFPGHELQETGQNGKLVPSSLSYGFVTSLLRGELSFNGLVFTDDLEMGAIINNFGIEEACKMALAAGTDMLAICADPQSIRDGYRAVADAVASGGIDIEAALGRIAACKKTLSPPLPFDEGRLQALAGRTEALNARLGR